MGSPGETPTGGPTEGEAESDAELQESLRRIEAGSIPLAAVRRLSALRDGSRSFTSDLSVADFALCHQLGLRPLSQVMGSSIYQVGWLQAPWSWTQGGAFMVELAVLSQAWNEVRSRALARLAEEAGHVGADAVVDLELRTGEHDWAEQAIEYIAIGTAVARPHGSTAGAADRPVLTELSMADFSKLERAGIEPLGIVAWSSAFFAASSYQAQSMTLGIGGRTLWMENGELPEYTQGFYEARETVMQRLTAQAAEVGASGVVGMRIDHAVERITIGTGRYERGGLMVTFHAIGTAIREREAAQLYAPETIVDLTW